MSMRLFKMLMLIPLCMAATLFSALTVISFVYQAEPASAQDAGAEGSSPSEPSSTTSTSDTTGTSSWDSGWGSSTASTPADSGSSQTSFNSTNSSYSSGSSSSPGPSSSAASDSYNSGSMGSTDSSSGSSGSSSESSSSDSSNSDTADNADNYDYAPYSSLNSPTSSDYHMPKSFLGSAASGDLTRQNYPGEYHDRIRYESSSASTTMTPPIYMARPTQQFQANAQVTAKPFAETFNLQLADPKSYQITGRIFPGAKRNQWFVETDKGNVWQLKADESLSPVFASLANRATKDVVLGGRVKKNFFTGNYKFKVEAVAYQPSGLDEQGEQKEPVALYMLEPVQTSVLTNPFSPPPPQLVMIQPGANSNNATYMPDAKAQLETIIRNNSYPYVATQPNVTVIEASQLPVILMIKDSHS